MMLMMMHVNTIATEASTSDVVLVSLWVGCCCGCDRHYHLVVVVVVVVVVAVMRVVLVLVPVINDEAVSCLGVVVVVVVVVRHYCYVWWVVSATATASTSSWRMMISSFTWQSSWWLPVTYQSFLSSHYCSKCWLTSSKWCKQYIEGKDCCCCWIDEMTELYRMNRIGNTLVYNTDRIAVDWFQCGGTDGDGSHNTAQHNPSPLTHNDRWQCTIHTYTRSQWYPPRSRFDTTHTTTTTTTTTTIRCIIITTTLSHRTGNYVLLLFVVVGDRHPR